MFHAFSFSQRSCRLANASLIALSALLASNAWAQAVGTVPIDRQTTRAASQANTPVPPVVYRSVFADLPQGVESTTLDWKAANANVGQFKRGHADLLKWEQEQATKARTAPANATGKPAAGDKP